MRKLIVTEFMSLDGVIEEPMWSLAYWNDQISDFKNSELFGVDDLLLGRKTYEGFAAAWPERTDDTGYADRINSMPKHVVTTTLDTLEWSNSRPISADIAGEVNRLKEQSGQPLLVFGSGELVQTLMKEDLVDEYWLLLYPVVLGSGQRLFKEGAQAKLRLAESKPMGSGVMLLRYEPARDES